MSTTLIDNFSYRSRRFLDARQGVATLAELKAVAAADIPEGFRAYCAETALWYEYSSANPADPSTGKWRKTKSEVAQSTGDSTEIPMSQKAVTDGLTSVKSDIEKTAVKKLSQVNSFNKFGGKDAIDGALIINGQFRPNYPNSFATVFYDVSDLSEFWSNASSNGGVYGYDENFGYVGQPPHDGYHYTIEGSMKYIRISFVIERKLSLYLYLKECTRLYDYGLTEAEVESLEAGSAAKAYTDDRFLKYDTVKVANQSVNKINPLTDWTVGFYLNPKTGEPVASSSSAISRFIDLCGAEQFWSNARSGGSVMGYDADFNFVSVISNYKEVPEGVKYIRITENSLATAKDVFLFLNEEDLTYPTSVCHLGNYIPYGVTYTDRASVPQLEAIPTKLDKFHTSYMNTLNMFSVEMIAEYDKFLNASTQQPAKNDGWWYTMFIPVEGGAHISCNAQASGSCFCYNKNKERIANVSWEPVDLAKVQNSVNFGTLPAEAAYIRLTSNFKPSDVQLFVGSEWVYRKYPRGENFDSHFKYRGKKLVTIGDSITYQRSWQSRLCELTGMRWYPKEVRGDDESVKNEGHGFIKLAADLSDTEEYSEKVEGATKTSETVTDGFGYAHPIWADGEGNKYRKPCRTAEGGETVMPVRPTSIYSRAADSKYYHGDVIIVFAGANDKVSYCDKYPTIGAVSAAGGVTNLTGDESEGEYEIYTDDAVLQTTGDYTDLGSKVPRYNHSFRACFRGLLKKVVDANPDAEVIVLGPFSTFVKAHPYLNRGYDYLTRKQNEVIEACAREFSCRYIDLAPLFGRYGADKYFGGNDGTVFIHPNNAGGLRIAEYIHSQL